MRMINVGFGNMLTASRVVAIVSPDSAPVKRMIQEARENGRLVDSTAGRRTRAVIQMDSGNVVLSALQPETLANRLTAEQQEEGDSST